MVLYIVVLGGIWSIFDPICFPFVFVSLSCTYHCFSGMCRSSARDSSVLVSPIQPHV